MSRRLRARARSVPRRPRGLSHQETLSSILRSPVVTTVAEATARACVLAAERGGTEVVVLSGGVFQNRRLLERTSSLLGAAGLRVLVPERLPPNDGGIAYGQLAAAAARLAAEETNAP